MPKLWEPYDLPVIGIAGESDSGKTMWGLTASPDCLDFNVPPPTLVWDTEGSSASYVGLLNFDRIDLAKRVARYKKKYGNLDMFIQWREEAFSLEAGKYQVCMLDTISEIEDGLQAYVRMHPGEFGYTSGQFAKMDSLVWTAMKAEWKRLLMDVACKCESLVTTMHMMYKWKGRIATTQRVPKGKETIRHVTSLYLVLSRALQPGVRQLTNYPSGTYEKGRLLRINPATGKPEPLLPPHTPNASPDGIRQYFLKPPDFSNLKPDEQARPIQELSEDDRLAIRAGIAKDEDSKARADLEKAELEREKMDEKSVNDLRDKVLAKVSLNEAKVILKTRYAVSRLEQLTHSQAADLGGHIGTLGN